MNSPILPQDDRPPSEPSLSDRLLARQIETTLSQRFFDTCMREAYRSGDSFHKRDYSLVKLLSDCQWFITIKAKQPTLIIETTDLAMSWRVLEKLKQLGSILEELAIARIRVCPPSEVGSCLEVRVDELSFY
ncbi:hypothetical protein NIES593_07055 [Hydrococcus rivularis NIES-593]|uniref:Uncharacterized protein n=1 Tax=Hydrococcus rivularis NIES-593 TaxID=1921803 RepID=A0A1U7HLG5_9CYAN|nr:hypothetical protein [Hydrococcus rivularis]OKH24433.1 hypothetical protein NIES593_07055 [Hydrococcus rivularis NIES-593]